MKIAFYVGSLSKGGAERVVLNLTKYFLQIGYEVIMVNYHEEENEYALPKQVKRYIVDLSQEEITNNRIVNFQRRFCKLRNVWKKEKPDRIVSFIGKTNLMTIATSRFLHIPVVVSVRSNPEREYCSRAMQLGMKILFPMADGIVLQTNQAKTYFPKTIQKKSVILPNSISEDFIRPYYQGERVHNIVSVGRIDQNKNQMLLVQAFHELIKENKWNQDDKDSWRLVLYGDGSMREQIEQYCIEQHLTESVIFMGVQDNIADQIQKASIFVLTSRQEGMPNALIEAMALGLAVISTDCPCGGPADLIQDGLNGYLIPVDNKNILKKKLFTLIEQKEKRDAFGKKACEIVERLHPDKVNEMWCSYLKQIGN